MTRSTGIVSARERVLGCRAFLHEELSLRTEQQDMDGPVLKTALVDFATGGLPNDFVGIINDIKQLVGGLHGSMKAQPRQKENPPRFGGFSDTSL